MGRPDLYGLGRLLTFMLKGCPMRSRLLYSALLFTVLTGGCSTPVLTLQEPTNEEYVEARQSLHATVLSEFTIPPDWSVLQKEFDKIAVRVISAADRLCREVRPHYGAAKCGQILLRPQIYRSDDINAFADEKDRVGILTGLLDNMRVQSEIAAVLAHEYAHVMLGHVDKKQSNTSMGILASSMLVGFLAGLSGQQLDLQTLDTAQGIGIYIGSRAYSPEMELEADRLAVYMLQKAEYPVTAMRDVLVRTNRLKLAKRPNGTALNRVGFLETHPSNDRRMAHVLAAISDVTNGLPVMK